MRVRSSGRAASKLHPKRHGKKAHFCFCRGVMIGARGRVRVRSGLACACAVWPVIRKAEHASAFLDQCPRPAEVAGSG